MFEVIPSPGTQDNEWSAIEKKFKQVKPFAKTIHVDIVDGKFAPNKTFSDPAPFAAYTNDFLFEVHLMVEEPINHLKRWADVGFRRFIGQIEKMSSQEEFVAQAEFFGEVGLGVDGPTPLEQVIVPYEDLDLMLFYTADRAGFSGKSFEPDRLDKVKQLRKKAEYLPIEIDGGVNDKTIQVAYVAGATRFVTTGFLFSSKSDPQTQYDLLEVACKKIRL